MEIVPDRGRTHAILGSKRTTKSPSLGEPQGDLDAFDVRGDGGLSFARSLHSAHAQSPRQARPNVVLIITDDLGWADVGSYGATDLRTPHIDSLARDGIRLTDFYANGTTCTPTRAGLISGRYQQRFALEAPLPSATAQGGDRGLPATGYSLPRTAQEQRLRHGADRQVASRLQAGVQPERARLRLLLWIEERLPRLLHAQRGNGEPDLWENERPIERRGYTTDLVTERAIRFIEEHAREPFFVDIAYNAPHWPYQLPGTPSEAPTMGAT